MPRVAIERVTTVLALKIVVAVAAHDGVVTIVFRQIVSKVVAGERIVIAAADDALDAVVGVTLRVTAARAIHEVNRDARGALQIRHKIDAGASVQRIPTCVAGKHIVALSSVENVVPCVTEERVVEVIAGNDVTIWCSPDALDAEEHVPQRIARVLQRVGEVDNHRPAGTLVRHHIVAVAAVHRVRSRSAVENVVALIAVEEIRSVSPFDEIRTQPAIERIAHITAAEVIIPRTTRKVHGDQRKALREAKQ